MRVDFLIGKFMKQKRYLVLIFCLIFLSLSVVVIRGMQSFVEEKYLNNLLKEKPYLRLQPKRLIIKNIDKNESFISHNFKDVIIELPKQFNVYIRRKNGIMFKGNDSHAAITLITKDNDIGLQDPKQYFNSLRAILYTTQDDVVLLSKKASIIPNVGDKPDIYEFEIGKNKGFLYKGKTDSKIEYYFNIFTGSKHVVLIIMMDEGQILRDDEINYIVYSIKTLESGTES